MSIPDSRKITIAVLAAAALGVVFLLPLFVSEPLVEAPDPAEVRSAGPEEVAPSRAAEKRQFRDRAQDTLAEVFRLRDELEALEVSAWNGERFRRALDTVAAGDEQYSRGEYEQALASYDESLAVLESLKQESETLRRESLEAVAQAIEAGLVEKARRHIALLNHLAPDDERVTAFAARVEKLPEVAALLEKGERLRAGDDLAGAEAAFASAAELDPDHERAAAQLEQVRAAQNQSRFSRRMGQGYSAMESGDFAAARSHFEAARQLRPDSGAVNQALSQLENRGTQLEVDRQLAAARKHEADENWQRAVDIYEQLIGLDPSLTEPRARLVPARVRAELDSRLETLIDKPLALSRPDVAARARQALADARGIPDRGDKLAAQIDRLAMLLERSTEPVQVQFRSDNQTEVTLYRVGELGTFESRTLELKPGRYVAAGARKGYRDVRVEFTVTGEASPDPVVVRCTETI